MSDDLVGLKLALAIAEGEERALAVLRALGTREHALRDMLEEVADELRDRADVEDGNSGPKASWEMQLLDRVERALKETKR